MKRQFLLPSLLGAMLMVCLLLLLSTSLRTMSSSTVRQTDGTMLTEVERNYGAPPMLSIASNGPSDDEQVTTKTTVHWGSIAGVLAGAWLLCMPFARWVTGYARRDGEFAGPRYAGWRHPAATLAYVLAGCAVVAFICALVFRPLFPTGEGSLGDFVFGFFMFVMFFAVPVTMIVMIVRRWRHRSRSVQRGFAVELSGTGGSGVAGAAQPQ
jgi:hypothetical protein